MRITILSSLFLSACSGGISGVWTIEIPADDGEDDCTDKVSHNYDNATVIESDGGTGTPGGVQVEESIDASPSLIVVSIEQSDGSNATLLVGNELYPGTKGDAGWSFTWERSNDSTESQEYKGYTFDRNLKSTGVTTWNLTATGDLLSGSVDATSESTADYSESDEWSEDAAAVITASQIPSRNYLTIDRDGNTLPANNSSDKVECGEAKCSMKVTSSCEGSFDISGARTGYETEDMGDKVIVAGQAGGSI